MQVFSRMSVSEIERADGLIGQGSVVRDWWFLECEGTEVILLMARTSCGACTGR